MLVHKVVLSELSFLIFYCRVIKLDLDITTFWFLPTIYRMVACQLNGKGL